MHHNARVRWNPNEWLIAVEHVLYVSIIPTIRDGQSRRFDVALGVALTLASSRSFKGVKRQKVEAASKRRSASRGASTLKQASRLVGFKFHLIYGIK